MHTPAFFLNHAALAALPAALPRVAAGAQASFSAGIAGMQQTPAHS